MKITVGNLKRLIRETLDDSKSAVTHVRALTKLEAQEWMFNWLRNNVADDLKGLQRSAMKIISVAPSQDSFGLARLGFPYSSRANELLLSSGVGSKVYVFEPWINSNWVNVDQFPSKLRA